MGTIDGPGAWGCCFEDLYNETYTLSLRQVESSGFIYIYNQRLLIYDHVLLVHPRRPFGVQTLCVVYSC